MSTSPVRSGSAPGPEPATRTPEDAGRDRPAPDCLEPDSPEPDCAAPPAGLSLPLLGGPSPRPGEPLPLAGEPLPERADAARNRARILAAAQRLVAEHGAARVTMEEVAAAAAVGKGTVFRRFGDRAGLMLALLDRAEQEYQRAFLSGPPPLGPGAPAAERLRAFGAATLRHEIAHREFFVAADASSADRYGIGPRRVRAAHVAILLRELGTAGDVELLTEVLLGYLDTGMVNYLHSGRGMSVPRLVAGWEDLVDRLTRA
jgi:AcrR family transcriptional regulator